MIFTVTSLSFLNVRVPGRQAGRQAGQRAAIAEAHIKSSSERVQVGPRPEDGTG